MGVLPLPRSAAGATPRDATRAPRARGATEWICAGRSYWRGGSAGAAPAALALRALRGLTRRVAAHEWVRYRIDLANVPEPAGDVRLTQLTAEHVTALRRHPDFAQEAFASGLAFWDMGIRGGLVWFEDGQPLCFQYLLGDADTAALREKSAWANMYPPLRDGTAQLEKLWTFSTARKKGIASRYALAMFAEARRRGYRSLVTHIHEANEPARSWAQRTGWQAYGSIVRYQFDVPLLRRLNLSVSAHELEAPEAHER